MDAGEGEGAILQLQQENARLRELYERRSREIELKMGELRSALHQANEKYKELESLVGGSRSSDSGLKGEEPGEESGAQADLRFANTNCTKCNDLERQVKELASMLSDKVPRKEEPLKEVSVQATTTGKECASLSTFETSKRQSENSEEEPPRKVRPVATRASEEDATVTDQSGMSPLHRAAKKGAVWRVRELISSGADTRLRDRAGMTPLHWALCWGKEKTADVLAEADCGNDIVGADGQTPLHCAAIRGHVGAVRKLLAGGARTRVRDRLGQMPLHAALACGKEAAAELIAEADGSIDVRDQWGRTPLHHAVCAGFRGIVATLLRNDLNPHLRDNGGEYPIQRALGRGRHEDIPKLILSSYALKDIAVDWGALRLAPDDLRFCLGELSRCSEEIRLMKDARVGASSVSFHDLVTRHVSAVAPRLPRESIVQRDGFERDFPHYAELISLRLRAAEERRVLMDRCRECFSLLPRELPLLPVTCTDVILNCLASDTDLEHFIRAVQLTPTGIVLRSLADLNGS